MRSAIAPVKIENKSHGKRVEMVIPAISTGSRVRMAASSGNAVTNMPSPELETRMLSQTKRKSRPSCSLCARFFPSDTAPNLFAATQVDW